MLVLDGFGEMLSYALQQLGLYVEGRRDVTIYVDLNKLIGF